MAAAWYDTAAVHRVIHALARAPGGRLSRSALLAETGLASVTLAAKVSGAKRRVASVPGASITGSPRPPSTRRTDDVIVLVGLTPEAAEALLGPYVPVASPALDPLDSAGAPALTVAARDASDVAGAVPSVRVTLASAAGRYVFAAGTLYRDGRRCDMGA